MAKQKKKKGDDKPKKSLTEKKQEAELHAEKLEQAIQQHGVLDVLPATMRKHLNPQTGVGRAVQLRKRELKRQLAAMMLQNEYTQWELAEILGCTTRTVQKYQNELDEEWRESYLKTVNNHKHLFMRRTSQTMEEAWQAWERSKKNQKETKSTKKTGGKVGEEMEETEIDKENIGDPRFLEMYQKRAQEIARMHGVDMNEAERNINVNILMPDLPHGVNQYIEAEEATYEDMESDGPEVLNNNDDPADEEGHV